EAAALEGTDVCDLGADPRGLRRPAPCGLRARRCRGAAATGRARPSVRLGERRRRAMSETDALREARRIVVKVGSTLVTDEGRGIDNVAVGDWCRQMAELVRSGRELVMVSSGAIAEGMKRLGWPARPRAVHELQAAAAVGQMGLAQIYES